MIEHGTLEANICTHCMKKCACCSHASPWNKPYVMPPQQLERDLAILKTIIHCDKFFALGGEPLLHPSICDILDVIRQSGICREVGVLTNGMLLDRVPEQFWSKVDVLNISVYPDLDRNIIRISEENSKRHGFYLGLSYIDLFWKQFAWQPDGRSFFECHWKGSCWTVHDGHFYLCPNAAFWPATFMGLPQHTDGLPIDESLTEHGLRAYIDRKEPFVTCRICRSFAVQVPWHEVRDRDAWMKDATL